MKTVKLSVPLLIGDVHYGPGDVVLVTDDHAYGMVRSGHAEPHDGKGEVANADAASPLAEAITPHPPGGAVVNPVDALSPTVADNPGLVALAKAAGKGGKVKSTRVEGDAKPSGEVKLDEATTAADIVPQAGAAPLAAGAGEAGKAS